MRKDNKTIYEVLDEIRESVTISHYFKGETEELKEVCNQLEVIASESGGVLPMQFEISVQEGNFLYKMKEFFQKLGFEVKNVMIGKREKENKKMPIIVTLK